eukprot:TRINITY_DN3663_c0_g1_i1.p1 TRINITY_DN3663_c0_g1~~TRINITY_DN3663_c0_g1_i1.p1  ORF type:complete len:491 (-),score=68.92 TRINITY_DN3663_c0_g1_i1:169-1641(-)
MLGFPTKTDLVSFGVALASFVLVEQVPGHDFSGNILRKLLFAIVLCVIVFRTFTVADHAARGWLHRASRQGAHKTIDPAREKQTDCGVWAGSMEWASSEMQGWRPAMEDAVSVVASMPAPLSHLSFFAVFDGHGGSKVSKIAAQQLSGMVAACATGLIRSGGATSPGLAKAAGLAPEVSDSSDDGVGNIGDAALDHRERFGSKNGCDNGDAATLSAHSGSYCATGLAPADVGDNGENCGGAKAERPAVSVDIVEKALHLAMLSLDEVLRKGGAEDMADKATASRRGTDPPVSQQKNIFDLMGSTAIIAVMDRGEGSLDGRPSRVTIANCGDSRAVLCRNGIVVELSIDQKPELPVEEERIRKAGGHVAMVHPSPCHRVDGVGLNLARALGDFHYKSRLDLPCTQQKVIAVPEVSTVELVAEDEFIVLGCDGVFELNTSQKVVDLIKGQLDDRISVDKAAEHLVDVSCTTNPMRTHGLGADNCSAVVIRLR